MTTPTPYPQQNRQQRRAAIKAKRHAPQRTVTLDAGMRLLHNARPYDEGEMVAEHIYTRECFDRLRGGSGDEGDFDRLGMILNVGLVRAESINPQLVTSMQAAQDAMTRMKARYLRGLRFGFDAQGLHDTIAAMADFEVIFDASSPQQMKSAIQEAYKRITDGQVLTVSEKKL